MDGISRALGSNIPVEFEGKTYLLGRFKTKYVGDIEAYLLSKRKSAVQTTLRALASAGPLPEELRRQAIEIALHQETSKANYVTRVEIAEFIDTREGLTYTIWLMLRANHPDMTFEEVNTFITKMTDDAIDQLIRLRDQAAGTDELGNETGQPQATAASQNPESQKHTSESNGEASSEKSATTFLD